MPRPQRIAFLVPGEQSGHCGVTDYAFWLIAAAIEQGSTVCVLSLYRFPFDHYIHRIPESCRARLHIRQPDEWQASPEQLSKELRSFSPDHTIIQFTPPAFRKGRLMFLYSRRVFRAFRPFTISLIVHETWLRPSESASLRNFALRQLRRCEILAAFHILKAQHVYVSNPLHQAVLMQSGLQPRLLPLFSNIPGGPRPPHDGKTMLLALEELGIRTKELSPAGSTPCFALIFARIPPDWDPSKVLLRLREEISPRGPLVLISAGETGYSNMGWERVIKAADSIRCIRLGPQPPEIIRRLLHLTNYGLCPIPLRYWMKSSACAAMVACETPMIFSDDHLPRDGPLPPHFATLAQTGLTWHRPKPDRIAAPTTPASTWKRLSKDAQLRAL